MEVALAVPVGLAVDVAVPVGELVVAATQEPAIQVVPAEQAWPTIPQLLISFCVSGVAVGDAAERSALQAVMSVVHVPPGAGQQY